MFHMHFWQWFGLNFVSFRYLDTPFNIYSLRINLSWNFFQFFFQLWFVWYEPCVCLFSLVGYIRQHNMNSLSWVNPWKKIIWLILDFERESVFYAWIVGTCSKHLLSILSWSNTKYTTWTLLQLEMYLDCWGVP